LTLEHKTRTDIPYAGLHVLADDDPRWPIDPIRQAQRALQGGARVIQLRTKHATDRQTLVWADAIRAMTRDAGARFVVNDRFDLALASKADAVHLGQDDLAPADLPSDARARLAIGRSTHDPDQAKRALTEGIAYLAYGPLFGTQSKVTPYDPRGLERLGEIAALAKASAPSLPIVVIGGMTHENIHLALARGATGAAVISAVAAAEKPADATAQLVACFDTPHGQEAS
jgi:thiamine-phosphate pyrophosphorylase